MASNPPVDRVLRAPILQQAWLFEAVLFPCSLDAVPATCLAIPLVSPACQAGRRGIRGVVGKKLRPLDSLTPIISASGLQRLRTLGRVSRMHSQNPLPFQLSTSSSIWQNVPGGVKSGLLPRRTWCSHAMEEPPKTHPRR